MKPEIEANIICNRKTIPFSSSFWFSAELIAGCNLPDIGVESCLAIEWTVFALNKYNQPIHSYNTIK